MNVADIEFLAENSPISIVPRFALPAIDLVCRSVGPFTPNMSTQVPLWLALYFRSQAKCHIVPPDWLTVDRLTELKEAEETGQLFTEMPHTHFIEVGNLLLSGCPEDIPRSSEVRVLLRDLWDVRLSKLRGSVTAFTLSAASTARVSHVAQMELCAERSMLTRAMSQLQVLRNTASDLDRTTSQTQ